MQLIQNQLGTLVLMTPVIMIQELTTVVPMIPAPILNLMDTLLRSPMKPTASRIAMTIVLYMILVLTQNLQDMLLEPTLIQQPIQSHQLMDQIQVM